LDLKNAGGRGQGAPSGGQTNWYYGVIARGRQSDKRARHWGGGAMERSCVGKLEAQGVNIVRRGTKYGATRANRTGRNYRGCCGANKRGIGYGRHGNAGRGLGIATPMNCWNKCSSKEGEGGGGGGGGTCERSLGLRNKNNTKGSEF